MCGFNKRACEGKRLSYNLNIRREFFPIDLNGNRNVEFLYFFIAMLQKVYLASSSPLLPFLSDLLGLYDGGNKEKGSDERFVNGIVANSKVQSI